MSFKAEVKQELRSISTLLRAGDPVVKELKQELVRLRAQNEKLMDRLMAVDYEKYRTFAPEDFVGDANYPVGAKVGPNLSDDELAGEMVEVKEGAHE